MTAAATHFRLRPLRGFQLMVLVALLLTVSAIRPAVGAAASSFYYLGFDDRIASRYGVASDSVGYSYTGTQYVNRSPQLQLLRGGEVIAESPLSDFWWDGVTISVPSLAVGDVLRLRDSNTGTIYAQTTYQGHPSFDEGACGPLDTLRGLRTAGAEISFAGAYLPESGDSYYGGSTFVPGTVIEGDGPGTRLEVDFDKPVSAGLVVWAEESYAISNTVSVRSFREQRVRPCSVSPTTPAATTPPGPSATTPTTPLADTIAPTGTVKAPKGWAGFRLAKVVSKEGLAFTATSNEPAKLSVAVTLITRRNGKVRRTAVGNDTASLGAAAQAPIVVRVPIDRKSRTKVLAAGRSGHARLSFSFTLRDTAGNARGLDVLQLKLPRR